MDIVVIRYHGINNPRKGGFLELSSNFEWVFEMSVLRLILKSIIRFSPWISFKVYEITQPTHITDTHTLTHTHNTHTHGHMQTHKYKHASIHDILIKDMLEKFWM